MTYVEYPTENQLRLMWLINIQLQNFIYICLRALKNEVYNNSLQLNI